MDIQKLLEQTAKLRLKNGGYKCYDCGKEIKGVHFDDETRNKLPIDNSGFIRIICKDCKDNEDY